jgi:MSHA pilin protein MshA
VAFANFVIIFIRVVCEFIMIWQQVVLLKNFSNVIKIKSRMDQTMQKINKQAGFTLIELIMVIVILGVLAAFALPRFADLGSEARGATIEALGGAIKAASNIAHSKQLAAGAGAGVSVILEGPTTVTMVSGYPTADADGMTKAAQISSDDYAATDGAATATSVITYTVAGFTAVDDTATTDVVEACQVTYTSPNVVAVDTSGC